MGCVLPMVIRSEFHMRTVYGRRSLGKRTPLYQKNHKFKIKHALTRIPLNILKSLTRISHGLVISQISIFILDLKNKEKKNQARKPDESFLLRGCDSSSSASGAKFIFLRKIDFLKNKFQIFRFQRNSRKTNFGKFMTKKI